MTAMPTLRPVDFAAAPAAALTTIEVLRLVSDLVARLGPDDDTWTEAGPRLTAVVDATRRSLDGTGSPLATAADAPAVVRLRDLGRTVQRAFGSSPRPVDPHEVADHLAALARLADREAPT